MSLIWYHALYLISGIGQSLVLSEIYRCDAEADWTMVAVTVNFLAMAAESIFISRSKRRPLFPLNQSVAITAALSAVANFASNMGLSLAGSGLAQVVASGGVLSSAVLARLILKRTFSNTQWISVGIVTAGLAINGMRARIVKQQLTESSALTVPEVPPMIPFLPDAFTGFLLCWLGSTLYTFVYVLYEIFIRPAPPTPANSPPSTSTSSPNSPTAPVSPGSSSSLTSTTAASDVIVLSPAELCYLTGFYGTAFMLVYQAFYTIPHFRSLILVPMAAKNASVPYVIFLYALYFLCSFGLNFCFFRLLKISGNLSTGINKAFRAVAVFFLSSYLFCERKPVQCLDSVKVSGLMTVIFGALLYMYSSAARAPTPAIAAVPHAHKQ